MATRGNPYSRKDILLEALLGSLGNVESVGRGFAAAPVGLLGDIEELGRKGLNYSFGAGGVNVSEQPVLPTTAGLLSNIPRISDTRQETAGMEQMGAAMNPRGPIDAARLAGRGATEVGKFVAPKAGQLAENYMQSMGMMPGIIEKAPRMSAAQAEALGYWHDIGAGKKLPIPVSQMKMDLQPIANLPPKIVASPESMQGGAIVPFVGDRSAAGQNLLGIGDVQFQTPVPLEGGYDFMRMQSPTGSIWASEKGASRSLQNAVNEAAKIGGGDVFGMYSAMGPESMNFNTMMSDALLEQMKAGKIFKKDIASFDKQVKALRPEWKGVMHPESRAQLESNGALRHAFVDRMQLDEFQNAGFPNIAYTRYAITDPLLLNEPMYSGGLAIGKMKPGADLITNPVSPHKTYDTQLAGEYFGGLEQSLPKEVLFPDWYKKRRMANTPVSGDVRSFQLSKPIQPTNQEWLDGVMQYLANQKSLLE